MGSGPADDPYAIGGLEGSPVHKHTADGQRDQIARPGRVQLERIRHTTRGEVQQQVVDAVTATPVAVGPEWVNLMGVPI